MLYLLCFLSLHSSCHSFFPVPTLDTPFILLLTLLNTEPPPRLSLVLSNTLSTPSHVFSFLVTWIFPGSSLATLPLSLSFLVTSSLDLPWIFPNFPSSLSTPHNVTLLPFHHASPYLTSPLSLIPCNTVDSFPTVIPTTSSSHTAWSVHCFL